MVEAETVNEAAEASANGICQPQDTGEVPTKVEEKNGVEEMDEDDKGDEKAEAVEMDEGHNLKEEDEMDTNEEEEGGESMKMEQENDSKTEESGKVEENKEEVEQAEDNKDGKQDEDNKEDVDQAEHIKEDMEQAEENKEDLEQAEHSKEDVEQTEDSKEEVEQTDDVKEEKIKSEESEEENKAMETTEVKSSRKRRKGQSVVNKKDAKKGIDDKKGKEQSTPTALAYDRPVRERKSVERLVASIEKEPAREFLIGKGRGTALKDIPNVAFKLSRKKTDETFKMLHVILFGRRGKAFQVKHNISQFSGFVWHENEEKQKLKIKEKLDKCVKEKLLEFCDVLDIPVVKATTKKEDIVTKLLDFMAAPHATTDVSLAEKEKSNSANKRKRVVKSSMKSEGTPAKHSAQKRRKIGDSLMVEEKKSASETEDESEEDEEEEKENGIPDGSEDEVAAHSESQDEEDESKEESEEETRKQKKGVKKSSSKKDSSGKIKSKKIATPNKETHLTSPKQSSAKSSSRRKVDGNGDGSPRVFSRKKKNEVSTEKKSSTASKILTKGKTNKEKVTPSKTTTKEKANKEKSGGKRAMKDKSKTKQVESGPTEDELRDVICEILKKVDFNTATFTDILKQVAKHFNMDLTPRKSDIKLLIQEELTKLAEEDADEESGSEKEEDPERGSQEVGA